MESYGVFCVASGVTLAPPPPHHLPIGTLASLYFLRLPKLLAEEQKNCCYLLSEYLLVLSSAQSQYTHRLSTMVGVWRMPGERYENCPLRQHYEGCGWQIMEYHRVSAIPGRFSEIHDRHKERSFLGIHVRSFQTLTAMSLAISQYALAGCRGTG